MSSWRYSSSRLQLVDQLLFPLVGTGAEQGSPQVVADPEGRLALTLRPAVGEAVADHDQHAHRFVPGADWHQKQFAGIVCDEVAGQVVQVVILQSVVAPYTS